MLVVNKCRSQVLKFVTWEGHIIKVFCAAEKNNCSITEDYIYQSVSFDISIEVLFVFLEMDLIFAIIFYHHKNNDHKYINQVRR